MLSSTKALVLIIFMSVFGLAAGKESADVPSPCINKANENNVALQKSFNQCWEPLGMSYLAFNTLTGRGSLISTKNSFACQSETASDQKLN